jgi:hypothetical protein
MDTKSALQDGQALVSAILGDSSRRHCLSVQLSNEKRDKIEDRKGKYARTSENDTRKTGTDHLERLLGRLPQQMMLLH